MIIMAILFRHVSSNVERCFQLRLHAPDSDVGRASGLYIQNKEKCTSEKVLVDIEKPPDNRDLMSTSPQGEIMHA